MRTIKFTNKYAKDLKTVQKYPEYNEKKLNKYIHMIAAGEQLPQSCRDHQLSKSSPPEYQGLRNFHAAPNLCVLYNRTEDAIILHRIGKHNNLKLTEVTELKMHARF